jgi:hypothetical protein
MKMKNTYYHECPICGAALDPDETCEDCFPRVRIPYPDAKDYKAVKQSMRKEVQRNGNDQKNRK